MYLPPCISPPTTPPPSPRSYQQRHRGAARRSPSFLLFTVPVFLLLFGLHAPSTPVLLLSLRSFKSLCASSFLILTRNGMYMHPRTRSFLVLSPHPLHINSRLFLLFLRLLLLPSLGIFPLHSPVTTHTNDAASQPRRIVEPVGSSRSHRLLH